MKDYSMNDNERETFILKYKTVKGRIVYLLATGEKIAIPYTEENEKKILEKMKNQVNNSKDFYKNCKSNLCYSTFFMILGALLFAVPISCFGIFGTIQQLIALGGLGLFISGLTVGAKNKKKMEDVCKCEYFLENAEEINKRVKDNENMLYKTNSVTKAQVEKNKNDKVTFTINTIDNIPFSDLEQIMINIEREDKFNFEYPEEEKSKKKIK